MIRLNLPSFEIKLSGTREHPVIFDVLRRRYVSLTPEEWVRQHFIHYLIDHKGYPASLLANEVALTVGDKQLRADSVLYDTHLCPRMIIEYKAPSVAITPKVFDQAMAYNTLLHVDYVIVSNGLEHYCCHIDYETRQYAFVKGIPDYQDIT
ncbi:MAG: type I restriction enzyme HsdR N-terminal domain-containing protein [Prevotella sp.]|nr:type I restriction enzyme HsdR N-terminal domain-containing protein [Prevotella sp.]